MTITEEFRVSSRQWHLRMNRSVAKRFCARTRLYPMRYPSLSNSRSVGSNPRIGTVSMTFLRDECEW